MSLLTLPFHRDFAALALLLALGAGSGRSAEPAGTAPAAAVEIGVRSSVDERWEGVHKRGPIEHGKVYHIASLKQAPSPEKLLQPVDEAGLRQQLRQVLNTHGFSEVEATGTPDVVLTVLYGRGHLRNPYLANINGDPSSGGLAPTPAESQLAAAVDPRLHDKRQWGAYEQKVLAAQAEKLFIRVTAWRYPGDRKEKPEELWKTTMVVDEPDRQDLNALYPKMLAAGAQFFDRPIKEEEIRIDPAKTGRVKLGPLDVIETVPPAKEPGEAARGSR